MADTPDTETRTKGAVKAGHGRNIFDLAAVEKIEAGVGYSSAIGGVIEGQRTQCGLIHKARGTGARLHSHPNEQWNYVLKGRMRGLDRRRAGPGRRPRHADLFPAERGPRDGGHGPRRMSSSSSSRT